MSQQRALTSREEDYLRLIAAKVHFGSGNQNHQMKKYISHKTTGGTHIFNLEETYQKIQLAARVIVAIQDPSDVIIVSERPYGQRAIIKFAQYVKCISSSNSRWTPGTLTNQNTKQFLEPRLLIVTDPKYDRQAIIEASYVNIPCIALCNSESCLDYVDIAIPCNNRGIESVAMIYWMLAKEVLILRGELRRDQEWDVKVDLFFYKTEENVLEDGDRNEDDLEDNQANKVTWDETGKKGAAVGDDEEKWVEKS